MNSVFIFYFFLHLKLNPHFPNLSSAVSKQQQSSLFGSSSAITTGSSSGGGFFSGLGGKPSEDATNKNPFGTTASTGTFGQAAQTGMMHIQVSRVQ